MPIKDEEDDPVVYEVPVHLADHLRSNLYVPTHLAQFPLRPAYRPMVDAPSSARVKPRNQILQLDYPVNQQSKHFDKDAEDYLKQEHIKLQSSVVKPSSNYAVGVFRQGQLHLTPVKATFQMRPGLNHIDEAADEEDIDMEEEEKGEEEMQEVQMQFAKKGDRSLSLQPASYGQLRQQVNAEKWIDLAVASKEEAVTTEEFENLFSESEDGIITKVTPEEYLAALRYRSSVDMTGPKLPPVKQEDSRDKAKATKESVDKKYADVFNVLKTDKMLHFDTLSSILPSKSEDELLTALSAVSTSIDGRLVVKSDLICTTDTQRDARNAILKELSTKGSGVIDRSAFAATLGLGANTIQPLLEEVAVLDHSTRKWSFKLAADKTFNSRFASVANATKV